MLGDTVYLYERAFNPVTPHTIRATLMIRALLFDSPNRNMFNKTAPAVPIPIQTAYATLTCKNKKDVYKNAKDVAKPPI
ncbi:hypothetical protein BALH_0758 [Bacillus thuringiensis str. Al Hakam]|nr:hypothetical protein BALH_0758 [Bacillus thuringiensis str. Al Hakam]